MFQQDNHTEYEWERRVLHELYKEYSSILRERRLKLNPALITLTDSTKHWGLWDHSKRTILMSLRLIHKHPWHSVLAVLRHEMAHQFVDETLWDHEGSPHGDRFQYACERLGVPQNFSRATINLQENNLDWRTEKRDEVAEKLLERVRKLLALAASSNEHEALLAMNKVRELYAKHNLISASAVNNNYTHTVICHKKKQFQAHQQYIASLLVEHFFVKVIYFKMYDPETDKAHRAFEIIGTRENVLMAEYVYNFLLQQLDFLLQKKIEASEQKLNRFVRKSFRLGVLNGFAEKLRQTSAESPESQLVQKALALFRKDKDLDKYIKKIHPRLVNTSQGRNTIDVDFYAEGKVAGKSLTLNRAVTSTAGPSGRYLSSSRK